MPAISIILPIYNVEKYLHRCIDSILAQTFKNFECILIDDGSTDNSPAICDDYAAKDSRIVVIHQKNAGVAAARNAGLDIVKGEWIGFVDSDDWCDPDMFKVLYENAIKYNSDVSICGYRNVTVDGKIKFINIKCKNKLQILNREKALIGIFLQGSFGGYNWNKLVRASLFSQYKLRYDIKMLYLEDVLLFYELFKHIEKAIYFSSPYYNYFWNPESATNQFGLTKKAKTAFIVLDKIISSENCSKIKKKVLQTKVLLAHDLCKYYLIKNDYVNADFSYLKKIVSCNIGLLLFDFSIPLKKKIMCCLIFFPYLYRNFYSIYERLKK